MYVKKGNENRDEKHNEKQKVEGHVYEQNINLLNF
jgi:hypothetical protein